MILLFHNFLHFAKLLNKKYGTHTESRILHLHKIFYSAKSNFKIWEESHAVIKYIPDVLFDYKSIMLYPSYNSFAIDYSKPTMTKKDGSTFNAQRNNLSYIDIVAIYDIYGFPTGGGGPSVTSIK